MVAVAVVGSINQGIGQSQVNNQTSSVVSGGRSKQFRQQLQYTNSNNTGNNAALLNGGNGYVGSVNQAIGQSQVNNQQSSVVSGGSTSNSGNNYSVQSQLNTGSNAFLGQ